MAVPPLGLSRPTAPDRPPAASGTVGRAAGRERPALSSARRSAIIGGCKSALPG